MQDIPSGYKLNIDLHEVKYDLHACLAKCQVRGLINSATWLSELLVSIQKSPRVSVSATEPELTPGSFIAAQFSDLSFENFSKYSLAKCYFDTQQYARCAHQLITIREQDSHPLPQFLGFYARYMALEKQVTDDWITGRSKSSNVNRGPLKPSEAYRNSLYDLQFDMERQCKIPSYFGRRSSDEPLPPNIDGYIAYVYALVLIRLGFRERALGVLACAVRKDPLLWPAWFEMTRLFDDREKLDRLFPPNSPDSSWMCEFFRGKALLQLQESERALATLGALESNGFGGSSNLQADIAIAHERLHDADKAVQIYKTIFDTDPFRLTDADVYSNALFVKMDVNELAHLAQRCAAVDKYKPETCCVLGNLYGLRGQHDKAVLYFQRALRLQPRYALVWILLGHEYVEMQHLKLAIYAYNQAIIHNRHDHRGWYGLGQLYEFIKQPEHALYYYKRAQYLCPTDSRAIVALGDMYEKLGNLQAAKKCFWRAYSVGDMEGSALISLARCFQRSNQPSEAAAAYTQFVHQCEARGVSNEADLGQAYRYLANYHFSLGHREDAVTAINKCLDFPEIREEAKALCLQLTLLKDSPSTTTGPTTSEEGPLNLTARRGKERVDLTGRRRIKARRRLREGMFTSARGASGSTAVEASTSAGQEPANSDSGDSDGDDAADFD